MYSFCHWQQAFVNLQRRSSKGTDVNTVPLPVKNASWKKDNQSFNAPSWLDELVLFAWH
jgi:hypothetical protein